MKGQGSHMKSSVSWHNAVDLGIEGRGWQDPAFPFHRFPSSHRKRIPADVWETAIRPAGLRVRFATDSRRILARIEYAAPFGCSPTECGLLIGGVDCYGRASGKGWKWVGCLAPVWGKRHAEGPVNGSPQQVRSVIIKLGVRSPVEDPSIAYDATMDAGTRFEVDKDQKGSARVRQMRIEIPVMNVARRNL